MTDTTPQQITVTFDDGGFGPDAVEVPRTITGTLVEDGDRYLVIRIPAEGMYPERNLTIPRARILSGPNLPRPDEPDTITVPRDMLRELVDLSDLVLAERDYPAGPTATLDAARALLRKES